MSRIIFLILGAVTSIQYWLKNRLTRTGQFAFAGLVIAAAVGIDTDLTLAYQIFTLLAALFLLALLTSVFHKVNFEVTRKLPPFVTAGERFRYTLSIINLGKNAREGLLLLESLADPCPSYKEFLSSKRKTNRPGSLPHHAYRYWRAMITERRNSRIPEQSLPRLLKNQPVEISIDAEAEHRGHIEFISTTVAKPDPFGLFKAFVFLPHQQSLLVLPKRYDLPALQLPGKRVYQHGGVTLATSKGDTEEFVGLRDYRAGDPLQQIHWKSFARVGKPVVKEYQDEFFERYALVLDTFTHAGTNRIFEEAVSLAASFACTVETQENLLDLMFVGADTYTFTAGIGQLHTDSMLEILASVRACEDKSFSELGNAILERRPSLSGCILLLTAWDEDRRRLVDELTASGLPLEIFVITGSAAIPQESEYSLHSLEAGKMAECLAKL